MGIAEIVLIIACILFVAAVATVFIVRKKQGKNCHCDCSNCPSCCHCQQQEKK